MEISPGQRFAEGVFRWILTGGMAAYTLGFVFNALDFVTDDGLHMPDFESTDPESGWRALGFFAVGLPTAWALYLIRPNRPLV